MTMATSKLRALLVAAALTVTSTSALAMKPFTADYEAHYMGMEASGRMTLASAGGERWRYNLSISNALADMSQTTVFEEHGGQLRPLSGTDATKVLVKKTNKVANYDWSSGVASWTGDMKPDRKGPIKLMAGDMDALLINLALVRDVAAGKPMSYRMVEDGRVKQMRYTVAGKESITIGGKSQQATKVVSSDGDKQTIAWVVEGMPVPARILQRKNGEDSIDLRVRSVR
jgi:hypothetical protein